MIKANRTVLANSAAAVKIMNGDVISIINQWVDADDLLDADLDTAQTAEVAAKLVTAGGPIQAQHNITKLIFAADVPVKDDGTPI